MSAVRMVKGNVVAEFSEFIDPGFPLSQTTVDLTSMSTMDATNGIGDYVKQAAKWGMDAIAVTDTAGAQGFPEAASSAAKNDIKMIYGVEVNLVEDGEPIIFDENDEAFFADLKPGTWIRARGPIQQDDFVRDLTMTAYDIEVIKHAPRIDPYEGEKKRIELHTHSVIPGTLGRKIASDAEITKMADIETEERSVIVEGYVFDAEVRVLKSERQLLTMKVTDYTSSFILKKFSRYKKLGVGYQLPFNIQVDEQLAAESHAQVMAQRAAQDQQLAEMAKVQIEQAAKQRQSAPRNGGGSGATQPDAQQIVDYWTWVLQQHQNEPGAFRQAFAHVLPQIADNQLRLTFDTAVWANYARQTGLPIIESTLQYEEVPASLQQTALTKLAVHKQSKVWQFHLEMPALPPVQDMAALVARMQTAFANIAQTTYQLHLTDRRIARSA
ncbi:PHP domain-containing protein [Weissella confusa]|uniref:PHP domain-containing protein n=1 Tax=Weissella confusa TaxID=1583 RepID=A0A923NE32_WEICO|nr:PHP domain-containing protein [Weissella confusa]